MTEEHKAAEIFHNFINHHSFNFNSLFLDSGRNINIGGDAQMTSAVGGEGDQGGGQILTKGRKVMWILY